MNARAEKLLAEVMALPSDEREELADQLYSSVYADAGLAPEWGEEIERRVREVVDGTVKTIPAEEALANLRAHVGRPR